MTPDEPPAGPVTGPEIDPAGEPPAGPALAAEAGSGSPGLLGVADLDTSITQLRHRQSTMPERKQLEQVRAALAGLAARGTALEAERAGLVGRQREIDGQAAAIAERRRILEERLYSARGSSSRDLQAIEGEIGHLRQRQAELEEAELELMVGQDPLDAELGEIAGSRAQLEEAAGMLEAAVAVADVVTAAELSSLESQRRLLVAGIPADLMGRYETIRARLGGVGAARLVGNRCDGCHLELPSVEVERIRHLPVGTAVPCEQCGRLLVVAAGAAPSGG